MADFRLLVYNKNSADRPCAARVAGGLGEGSPPGRAHMYIVFMYLFTDLMNDYIMLTFHIALHKFNIAGCTERASEQIRKVYSQNEIV